MAGCHSTASPYFSPHHVTGVCSAAINLLSKSVACNPHHRVQLITVRGALQFDDVISLYFVSTPVGLGVALNLNLKLKMGWSRGPTLPELGSQQHPLAGCEARIQTHYPAGI